MSSDIVVWVGGACVVAGFLWLFGLLLGLRLRHVRIPTKALCLVFLILYFVIGSAVLMYALHRFEAAISHDTDETVPHYEVTRVIDGDTIAVDLDGAEMKIRVLGINTPETVDPRRPVECFGEEAAARAKYVLEGQYVELDRDPTQDDVDKYGRLLRYVTLLDGTDVGLAMITDGYAYEYTYRVPYERQEEYRAAQVLAQQAERGLWEPEVCE